MEDEKKAESEQPQQPRVIGSTQIFQGDREVQIEHEGMIYRLRITRSGKLILHK